jgi:hypothetical protein
MKYLKKFIEHINEKNDTLKELGVKDGKIDLSKTTNKIKQYLFKKGIENNDIEGEKVKITATDLEPSQKEIFLDQVISYLLKNDKFVKNALKGKIKDKEIVISSDNCIVDGHHKWIAAFILNPKCVIKCTKVNMTYKEAIPIFTEILKEFNPTDQNQSGNYKYNIFDLMKEDRDKIKSAIVDIFSHKQGEKQFLAKIEKKKKTDLHPINYLIGNLYKIPNPDHKLYNRKDMPQLSDREIEEIL